MKIDRILAVVALLTLVACGGSEKEPHTIVERDGELPIYGVEKSDEPINTAIETARQSVDTFIHSLGDPSPSSELHSVKVRLEADDFVEHMWLEPVHYRDGSFTGTLDSKPVHITTMERGDSVTVAKEDISDWMYVDGGMLVGGYTVRVLHSRLSDEERAEAIQRHGFAID